MKNFGTLVVDELLLKTWQNSAAFIHLSNTLLVTLKKNAIVSLKKEVEQGQSV